MEAKRRGELGDVEIVVMCRSNRKDIDVTVETLQEVGIEPCGSDVFHFYQRQRPPPQVQDRQDAACASRDATSRSGSTCRSNSIATPTSDCSATRSVTRAIAAWNASSSAPKTAAAATSTTSSSISKRAWKPAATARHGRTRSECLTPGGDALVLQRASWTRCPKDCRSSSIFHNDYGLGTINAITATGVRFQSHLRHGERVRRARGQRQAARV